MFKVTPLLVLLIGIPPVFIQFNDLLQICFFFLLTSSFAWALHLQSPQAATRAPVVDKEVRILRNEREDFEDGSYRF